MVAQDYESDADKEYVIRGNNAIMKCEIPSFVADFVSVQSWQDSNGNVYYPRDADYGNFSCVCFFSLLGLSVFFSRFLKVIRVLSLSFFSEGLARRIDFNDDFFFFVLSSVNTPVPDYPCPSEHTPSRIHVFSHIHDRSSSHHHSTSSLSVVTPLHAEQPSELS